MAEAGDTWDEGTELIDMEVTPIYEFMPDEDLARRVKVRMEASVQDMRDLYGELNFASAKLYVMTDYRDQMNYCVKGVTKPLATPQIMVFYIRSPGRTECLRKL